jgi:hypothetical protein
LFSCDEIISTVSSSNFEGTGWPLRVGVRVERGDADESGRCVDRRGNEFNVETTAWEGEGAWKPPARVLEQEVTTSTMGAQTQGQSSILDSVKAIWTGK